MRDDNALLSVNLTNPDVYQNGIVVTPRGTLHLLRSKFLWKGVCYECVRITNYGVVPIEVSVSFETEADFIDIFEVRGFKRERRGGLLDTLVEKGRLAYGYEGLDSVLRQTCIEYFAPPPLRMGHPDFGRGRSSIQSDVVPQRFDLAA